MEDKYVKVGDLTALIESWHRKLYAPLKRAELQTHIEAAYSKVGASIAYTVAADDLATLIRQRAVPWPLDEKVTQE